MRILLVTPMPPRPEAPGAIPLVLQAQVTGLRARHHLTLVTAFGDEPGEKEAIAALRASGLDLVAVDVRRRDGKDAWRRRWRLATTWARGHHPWRTVWFAHPGIQDAIDDLACVRDFDIVSVEDNSMAVFRLPRHLPAVLTEHEVRRPRPWDWTCGHRREWPSCVFRELDWRRWPGYQRRVWARFDTVQVFGARDATLVREIAPEVADRVRVTPFGIEMPPRADPNRVDPGTLLFMGNFRHPPNVDAARWLLDDIMPQLRARGLGARLRLVGGGAPDEIRTRGAPDVEIVGEVPSVAPELDAAAVVVAPMRTGGGMRVKVLWALGAGKAVVTTPRGAEGFVLEGGESPLVVAHDSQGIVEAVSWLLADPELCLSLGRRATEMVTEHYSAEAYGRRLEAVYAEAVSRRQARGRHASEQTRSGGSARSR